MKILHISMLNSSSRISAMLFHSFSSRFSAVACICFENGVVVVAASVVGMVLSSASLNASSKSFTASNLSVGNALSRGPKLRPRFV